MTNFKAVIIFCLLFLSLHDSWADNTGDLKKRYLSLRNMDPLVHKKSTWEDLAAELAKSSQGSDPALALESSRLYFELYKNYGDEQYFKSGVSILREVTKGRRASVDRQSEAEYLYCQWLESASRPQGEVDTCKEELIKKYPGTESAMLAEGVSSEEHVKESVTPIAGPVSLPTSAPLVVLDAGHGGEDFGAVGYANLYEKDVTLLLARSVASILNSKYQIRTELSRTKDLFIPLEERTSFANAKKADAFVSIHANASEKHQMSGFEVYYLDNADNKASELLASRENDSAQQQLSDIGFIISDMIQRGKIPASRVLATTIEKHVATSLKDKSIGIRSNGVRKAPFYVLVGAHMPCVLVETSYIDNATEGKKLGNENFRQKLAESLAAGIAEFLRDNTH
jgi:N-acetylmuramoyl-L-alanine amidase